MGHGSRYSREERKAVAEAWKVATSNPLVGADQGSSDFRASMLKALKDANPDAKEKYWHRGPDKIYMYWRDDIAKDLNHFLFVLREAYAAVTTGNLSEDEYHSIAVAKHLNQTTVCTYNYRDFDADKWMNYRAFLVVQRMPKFELDPSNARRPSFASDYDSSDNESGDKAGGGDGAEDGDPTIEDDGDSSSAGPNNATASKEKRTACGSIASKVNAKRKAEGDTNTISYKPSHKHNKHSRRGPGRDRARADREKKAEREKRNKALEDIKTTAEARMEQKNKDMKLRMLHLGLAANKDKDPAMSEKCRNELNAMLNDMFEEEEKEKASKQRAVQAEEKSVEEHQDDDDVQVIDNSEAKNAM
mmetsp:Transcript_2648/g.5577  ORF Transcript_2648/g.5577 Transcript_2648/m.5577 type:complete len:360 (-) Transcript_2648:110-1189(-)